MSDTGKVEKEQKKVFLTLTQLGQVVTAMESVCAEMRDRSIPVCRPDVPNDKKEKDVPESSGVPIAGAIEHEIDRIQEAREVLEDILSRLEI